MWRRCTTHEIGAKRPNDDVALKITHQWNILQVIPTPIIWTWLNLAHCCTIFLKSSGYRNIDDRHRNPNIHIREIIWLGNQLPSHLPIIRSTSSAPSRTRRSAATPTWRTRWTRWGRSRLRRSSKLQGWPFTSFRCLEHSTDMFLLGMFSRLPPPWREKTKKETKANSPETTKNLLSNAQPNTSNTVINSCYLFFSIYFLSTCYRQCINLSYRSMPLLFSCPTVIVIIVIFIFRKQKFV